MKLTPLDIRHKEFKRGMRGYADVEVDEFLDEVADEFERLFKENIDLQDRVEALEEKVAGYKRIEETLQKTLINAQASAEEQKQNATKQAQLILEDAELKARQMANEAYSERQGIEQTMVKLRSAEEDFRFKFKQMLEGYLRQLQEAPEATAAAPESDFARHAEAIKQAIARESAPAKPAAAEPAPPPAPYVAPADAAPRITAEDPEGAAPVSPARGHGGVQAGPPPQPAGDDEASRPPAAEPETTSSRNPADDDPEVTAAGRAPEPADDADEAPETRERVVFGETDDLLADVDTGVNENEFKW